VLIRLDLENADMKIITNDPTALAKRAFWLAWQACLKPTGMGVLQDTPLASEEDVWSRVTGGGDNGLPRGSRFHELYADYIFGRMMKCDLAITEDGVEIPTTKPRHDYQGWCWAYETYENLIQAAAKSLEEESTEVSQHE